MKKKPVKIESLKSIKLNTGDYLAINALHHCIDRKANLSRSSINQVYYNPKRDEFVATDGHIMRVHKVEWPSSNKKPKRGFFLLEEDFLHSSSSLKKAGNDVIDVPVHYLTEHEYPAYESLIRRPKDSMPVVEFAFDLELLVRLRKSFPGDAPVVVFRPGKSNIQGFQIYRKKEFLGVVMPIKIKDE